MTVTHCLRFMIMEARGISYERTRRHEHMEDGNGREPGYNGSGGPNNQDNIDKRIEDIRRVVTQGANEAQVRVKRIVDKANDYLQQAQTTPTPRQARSVEEQRMRQLANIWS